jgi:LuxR family transcriptional regulator, maltose regulon positive regulatory protein
MEQPLRLSPRHVRRPRLTKALDATHAQAVVLAAPAGYGKTTLALEWLERRKQFAWYDAARPDADVAAFSSALADAAARIVPEAGQRLWQRVRVGERPEEAARPLAELLAEDLAEWPSDAWLVIDDYHLVADSSPVEEFVDWLLALAPVRLLVTARRRPVWATARRVLYGEVLALGADELAMTSEEVAAVTDGSGAAVATLIDQANGWPAVVGLAALSAAVPVPRERLADAFYRYLAEEVLRAQPDDVQEFMLAAAVPPTIDAAVAREVLGFERPGAAIETLRDDGLLHPTRTGRLRFHPLLRQFLVQKLESERPAQRDALYTAAIEHARAGSRWQDAFELAVAAGRLDVAAAVLADVVGGLLDAGRVETVERALAAVGDAHESFPALVLARAEVLHRRGRCFDAAAIASELARGLPADDPNLAAAWHLAGRSYHLLSDDRRALECHLRASEVATGERLRAAALWGAIAASAELDGSGLNDLVARFEALAPEELDARLRLFSARVFRGTRNGTLMGIWNDAKQLLESCSDAGDPMAATTFLGAGSYLAVARGDYRLARELSERAVATCRDFRLGRIKTAFALCHLAAADIGVRRFARAEQTLGEIESLGIEHTHALLAEHLILRTKIKLARRELAAALEAGPANDVLSDVAEHAGLLSIAAAAAGDRARARAETARAEAEATSIEGQFYARLAPLILRIVAGRNGARLRTDVAGVIRAAAEAEILDPLVVAYRACPELLEVAARDETTRVLVRDLARRANDHALARHAGIAIRRDDADARQFPVLTPRESEVLELITQGLGNAEIARRLYISEKTAKVHVYHIFEKLGVESRVQAVIAARAVLDGAA